MIYGSGTETHMGEKNNFRKRQTETNEHIKGLNKSDPNLKD
jgi:hypothetical protein